MLRIDSKMTSDAMLISDAMNGHGAKILEVFVYLSSLFLSLIWLISLDLISGAKTDIASV